LAHDRFIVMEQSESICDFFLDAMEAFAAEEENPDEVEDGILDVDLDSEMENDLNESSEEEELLDI
jgi:hypothetical protein